MTAAEPILSPTKMNYDGRKPIIEKIESLRGGRKLVCFFNFDRGSEPAIPGLSTQFHSDVKEALFRVLKETNAGASGIDLCLYTRGGDTNSVWPIVNLVREFDPDFQVLVPFRCHSSGTLVALGAKKIVLGPISELSPIDPTTGNQFNPPDPADVRSRLAISVEDVRAYKSFVCEQLKLDLDKKDSESSQRLQPFMDRLVQNVHPLALGNVHRVLMQIKQLAVNLLKLNPHSGENVDKIVESLTTEFYSHVHMISRDEAKKILGERIVFSSNELAVAMDELLRAYEDSFRLRKFFFLNALLGDKPQAQVRFIGGVAESCARSYLFETEAIVRQYSKLAQNVQVQIPAGQPMPLIPGLPRETQVEVIGQGWTYNKEPRGVTL